MEFSEEHSWMGYRSLSNFVTAGARQLLQDARQEVYQKKLLESGVTDKQFLDNVAMVEASKSGRHRGTGAPVRDGQHGRLSPLPPGAGMLK